MKKLFSILLLLFALISFPSTAFMSWGPSYNGEPDMLNPGHIRGTFVWHDYNGFHLRTTTTGDKHIFTGTIHTNGHFINVDDRFFRNNDYFHLRDTDAIDYQFTTAGRTVGIDFDVAGGDYMSFELYIDGHKVNPEEIFIGSDGWHPENYKFTLDRPPYNYDNHVIIVHPGWYGGWGWGHGWGYHHW